jgi:hypothetical protein
MKNETLLIDIDGETRCVDRRAYVKAKLIQMTEFGYGSLTESGVDAQVDAVLAGRKFGDGLDIIGKFMEDDLSPELAKREKLRQRTKR